MDDKVGVDLAAAIEQLVNFGHSDPREAAVVLRERHGEKWLAKEVAAIADDVVAWRFFQRLNAHRRASERAIRNGDRKSMSELLLAYVWVPGVGRKRYADLTEVEWRLRASYDRRAGQALLAHADWCEAIADAIDRAGVSTAHDLDVLPEYPSVEMAVA